LRFTDNDKKDMGSLGARALALFIDKNSVVYLVVSTTKNYNNHYKSIKLTLGKEYNFEITVDGGHGQVMWAINGKNKHNEPAEGITAIENIKLYVSDKFHHAAKINLKKMLLKEFESS
jgi:hypothetical protein